MRMEANKCLLLSPEEARCWGWSSGACVPPSVLPPKKLKWSRSGGGGGGSVLDSSPCVSPQITEVGGDRSLIVSIFSNTLL